MAAFAASVAGRVLVRVEKLVDWVDVGRRDGAGGGALVVGGGAGLFVARDTGAAHNIKRYYMVVAATGEELRSLPNQILFVDTPSSKRLPCMIVAFNPAKRTTLPPVLRANTLSRLPDGCPSRLRARPWRAEASAQLICWEASGLVSKTASGHRNARQRARELDLENAQDILRARARPVPIRRLRELGDRPDVACPHVLHHLKKEVRAHTGSISEGEGGQREA